MFKHTAMCGLCAALGLLLITGCSKKESGVAMASTAQPVKVAETKAEASWKVGDKVDVKWKDSWWKAQVLAVNGQKYKIHYEGWANSWDEEVGTDRVRARTANSKGGPKKVEAKAAAKGDPNAKYTKGQKVDVEWKNSWWQGEILSVNGDKYKIHYVGWSNSWDEEVTNLRLRPRTDESKSGSGK